MSRSDEENAPLLAEAALLAALDEWKEKPLDDPVNDVSRDHIVGLGTLNNPAMQGNSGFDDVQNTIEVAMWRMNMPTEGTDDLTGKERPKFGGVTMDIMMSNTPKFVTEKLLERAEQFYQMILMSSVLLLVTRF